MQSFGWTWSASDHDRCSGDYYTFHQSSTGSLRISIQLPQGFSFFAVEYGNTCTAYAGSAVRIKLDGVVVDSIDNTCAIGSANPNKCDYTVANGCWKTFSKAYSHGAVLALEEFYATIGAIKTIKLQSPSPPPPSP